MFKEELAVRLPCWLFGRHWVRVREVFGALTFEKEPAPATDGLESSPRGEPSMFKEELTLGVPAWLFGRHWTSALAGGRDAALKRGKTVNGDPARQSPGAQGAGRPPTRGPGPLPRLPRVHRRSAVG